jgi:hypothetical protein
MDAIVIFISDAALKAGLSDLMKEIVFLADISHAGSVGGETCEGGGEGPRFPKPNKLPKSNASECAMMRDAIMR